ncbi:hypothetical protein [Pseudoxanthomonas winnipegensis]|uniref:hypothetical protein n=1 Tax=Pseudoxanthomonas winnipegensis TaxID=2480810 RepID=UPI0013EF1DC3|nr:hypothetical protein [Pseudoxanthomonas winnipegensis]
MRHDQQTDLFRDDSKRKAEAYRASAETERHNPYFTEAEREIRVAHYTAEAERLEALTR